MRHHPAFWAAALLLLAACAEVETPRSDVCFGRHVVPLVQRDCAVCHDQGEYGVELSGRRGDHASLEQYLVAFSPDNSPLLDWAAGYGEHAVIWGRGSAEYATMAAWIWEGAHVECFDRARYGDCRDEADCPAVGCLCPDMSFAEASVCYTNPETGWGTCARADNCANPAFGLCEPGGFVIEGEVSFARQIVPILASDCAPCHQRGMVPPTFDGTRGDYRQLMDYVSTEEPEGEDGLLWWVSGGDDHHPALWPLGSPKYELFLYWIEQGASND